jgi:phosphoenolpyruvate carboxykinase (ATP)
MSSFNFKKHNLDVAEVDHNLPPGALYEHAIRYEKDASIAENGALVASSNFKTYQGDAGAEIKAADAA